MRKVFLLLCLSACVMPQKRIIMPPEPAPAAEPRSHHVLRMSDGTRDWELEFPDVASGYEVRIPLRAAADPSTKLTAADRELLGTEGKTEARRPEEARKPEQERSPEKARTSEERKAKAEPPRTSLLRGIARVRELYRTRNYELALVDCVELDRQYPGNGKLLAMKGSIYQKLGKADLARQAWEQALEIDPEDRAVAAALERLDASEEEGDE